MLRRVITEHQDRDGGDQRHALAVGDAAYPGLLLQTADPPLLLYAAGRMELLQRPALAVVAVPGSLAFRVVGSLSVRPVTISGLRAEDVRIRIFGEMALIDGRPRSATAVAGKRSKLLCVDAPTFESMILANGKFAGTIDSIWSISELNVEIAL